jgi:hypothetical protein
MWSCTTGVYGMNYYQMCPEGAKYNNEIKDYVVLTRGDDNPLPPHTMIMDVTVTHDRYGHSTLVRLVLYTENYRL